MSQRILKVNQLIKKELSQIILKEAEFPKEALVTLTRVETLPNLSECKVWISVIPEGRFKEVFKILSRNIYFIQQKLNKRLKMKRVPKIRFLEERKTAEASKIEEILEKLKKEEK